MKKKAKKARKRRPKTVIVTTAPSAELDLYAMKLRLAAKLGRKVLKVSDACKGFETMGTGKDTGEGLEFGYTTAKQVFEKYAQLCRDNGLWYRPVRKEPIILNRQVFCNTVYALMDVDTGFELEFAGVGQGNNGVWAVNSGQTVALKQGQLETFMAFWVEPEDKGRKEVDYYTAYRTTDDPKALMEELANILDAFKAAREDKKLEEETKSKKK